jgi:methyl-accepting chemotaxis protein
MMLFQPATRLMNQLSYSRKMLVAALFFTVPTVLLTYFLVDNIQEQVKFAAKERYGVQLAQPLGKLLEAMLQKRDAAVSGGPAAAGARAASEPALAAVVLAESRLGDALKTKRALQSLKENIGKLSGLRETQARQSFEAHNALSAEILELMVVVADNSNLTLDPDIDSYYLMDSFTTKLPPLAEAISRANLILSRLGTASTSTFGDRTDLIVLSGQIRVLLDAVDKNIRVACGNNTKLSERLQMPLQEVDAATGAFLKVVTTSVSGKAPPTPIATGGTGASRHAMAAVSKAVDAVSRELDRLLVERIATSRSKMATYLSISFVAFLFGIYLNIGCYLSVSRGIISAKDASRKVAEGDLTVESPLLSRDELGDMARVFNTMTVNLRHIVATISQATDRVLSCAGKLADGVDQQSGFSTQLSSSVVEISSTMEEFSSTASQIAQHSHSVAVRADKTLDDTKIGAAEVENLSLKVNDISHNIQANVSEIVVLGRKSKEINKVMEIINNIANQTKLIAFNAALEAASAGEAGKRFGVVAVEIRRLADSVVESTAEIEGKITEILDSVNRLVMSSEKSFQLIQEGQEYASRTVSMLVESVDGVEETADAARQISLSTQQQQIASSQVVLALKDIEHGVRFAADSTLRTNSVTEELAQLSEQLRTLVSTFKIGNQGGR